MEGPSSCCVLCRSVRRAAAATPQSEDPVNNHRNGVVAVWQLMIQNRSKLQQLYDSLMICLEFLLRDYMWLQMFIKMSRFDANVKTLRTAWQQHVSGEASESTPEDFHYKQQWNPTCNLCFSVFHAPSVSYNTNPMVSPERVGWQTAPALRAPMSWQIDWANHG